MTVVAIEGYNRMDDVEWLRDQIAAIIKHNEAMQARLINLEVTTAVNATKVSIWAGVSGGISGGTMAVVADVLWRIPPV